MTTDLHTQPNPLPPTTSPPNVRRKRLRVRVRPDPEEGSSHLTSDGSWNLFVRLSDRVVRELVAIERRNVKDTTTLNQTQRHDIHGDSGEFLPLELRFPLSGETSYASYNGGALLDGDGGAARKSLSLCVAFALF